jgi:hypothetical protein
MRYIKIIWRHSSREYPVEIYSVLDSTNYEIQKIEFYSDGKIAYADTEKEVGTFLSPEPFPSLEEFNKSNGVDDVEAQEIDKFTFESAWKEKNDRR